LGEFGVQLLAQGKQREQQISNKPVTKRVIKPIKKRQQHSQTANRTNNESKL
jgi:hypothetical protein